MRRSTARAPRRVAVHAAALLLTTACGGGGTASGPEREAYVELMATRLCAARTTAYESEEALAAAYAEAAEASGLDAATLKHFDDAIASDEALNAEVTAATEARCG